MTPRIALVTIGQTPRTDLVPELGHRIGAPVELVERGALDGLTHEQIDALGPAPGEPRLVSRMRDGSQVVLGKPRVQERVQHLLDELAAESLRATVLLCTGAFPGLRGPGLFLDAQHLVDHSVAAICHGALRVGVLVPLAEQIDEIHWTPEPGQQMRAAHASPYEGDRFHEAGRELAECDVVVMHCMGYTEAQRDTVARASGRPVLLARRLVAAGIGQIV